jgi:hypothetical protein
MAQTMVGAVETLLSLVASDHAHDLLACGDVKGATAWQRVADKARVAAIEKQRSGDPAPEGDPETARPGQWEQS